MTPYARRGVHGQTVETLARRVLSGEIPEGATLDLVALQSELDVSLTALRESLKVLAAKGMVDARQKRGTFVRARADWNLLDADVLRWQFAGGTTGAGADVALLRNLAEVRGIIEPAAVRIAAERRRDEDLAALEAALGDMARQHGDRTDDAVAADLAFHRALLAATHNELLERMEMVIESGLAHRDEIVHSSPHGEDPVPSHRAVLDAVRARDAVAAESAMRALLEQATRDLDKAHGAAEEAGPEPAAHADQADGAVPAAHADQADGAVSAAHADQADEAGPDDRVPGAERTEGHDAK